MQISVYRDHQTTDGLLHLHAQVCRLLADFVFMGSRDTRVRSATSVDFCRDGREASLSIFRTSASSPEGKSTKASMF